MTSACHSPIHGITRRQLLGGLLATGVCGLPGLMQRVVAEEMRKRQKQVCFIWLDGGMSQFESWDPKPDSQFGGPFRSIPTSVPGVHVSELLPHTAKLMHKISLIRSMCTKDPSHSTGVARMQRGDPVNRGVDYPYLGSAVAKLLGVPDNGLPPYISIKPGNGGFLWQEAGFLGARYGALALGDGKPPIHIRRPDDLTAESDAARNELRRLADARFKAYRREAEVDAWESSFEMAEKLMARKELFDDSRARPGDADRYGRHPLGRHLLLARQLLEAGVQFVKVTSFHWDTHGDSFNTARQMIPQVDQPFAALVDDLEASGLLDHVVVVLMSEFGRTPTINSRLGRDHWPDAWSMAITGGGIQRGRVVGRTTADGVWIEDSPVDIGDLFHTIFTALGIDSVDEHYRIKGQPLPIAREECKPIAALVG